MTQEQKDKCKKAYESLKEVSNILEDELPKDFGVEEIKKSYRQLRIESSIIDEALLILDELLF